MSILWTIAAAQVDSANYLDDLRMHFEHNMLDPQRARGPSIRLHLDIGDPAEVLAALARQIGADLVVIGSADPNVLHDVVFGRVERRLERRVEIPLVVVPPTRSRLHVLQ